MRVTDRQIQEVIESLKTRDGRVTGAAVRTELARRYGARGGVSRIYRLLGAARGEAQSAESQSLLERAERAEHREVAHQDRAAVEIHNLREKLRELQTAPRIQGVQHDQYLRAYREVVRLRARVAELESPVIEGR